jgi:hypothetical protein
MEHMRRVAFEIVLRACSFGALAIFCLMFGMMYAPKAAFQIGGFLTLVMCAVLLLKAYEANIKDYRRTEFWLCLAKEHRPPAAFAQQVSATLLRETYLQVALWASAVAIALWAVALLLPTIMLLLN